MTLTIWSNINHSLIYLRSETLGCKDILIWKSKFVAKTQFIYSEYWQDFFSWYNKIYETCRFSSRDRALRSRRESLDNPGIYSQASTRSSSKNGSDQLHQTYRSSSRIGLDQLHSTYRSSPTSSNYTVDDCTSKYLNYISKYYDKSLNEPERAKQFDQKDDIDSIETLEGVDTYKENSMFDESTGSDNYLKTDISIHDETLNSERGSRLETLCSRCSMSPAPLIEYNPIDYKAMFEKEREEKQVRY